MMKNIKLVLFVFSLFICNLALALNTIEEYRNAIVTAIKDNNILEVHRIYNEALEKGLADLKMTNDIIEKITELDLPIGENNDENNGVQMRKLLAETLVSFLCEAIKHGFFNTDTLYGFAGIDSSKDLGIEKTILHKIQENELPNDQVFLYAYLHTECPGENDMPIGLQEFYENAQRERLLCSEEVALAVWYINI